MGQLASPHCPPHSACHVGGCGCCLSLCPSHQGALSAHPAGHLPGAQTHREPRMGIRNRAFTGIRSFHKPAIHRKYILSLSKVSGIMEAPQEVVRTCPAGRGPQGADGPFCGFRAAFLASLLAPLSSPLLPTPVGKKPEAVLAFPPSW